VVPGIIVHSASSTEVEVADSTPMVYALVPKAVQSFRECCVHGFAFGADYVLFRKFDLRYLVRVNRISLELLCAEHAYMNFLSASVTLIYAALRTVEVLRVPYGDTVAAFSRALYAVFSSSELLSHLGILVIVIPQELCKDVLFYGFFAPRTRTRNIRHIF
jgi:hypothetical protein